MPGSTWIVVPGSWWAASAAEMLQYGSAGEPDALSLQAPFASTYQVVLACAAAAAKSTASATLDATCRSTARDGGKGRAGDPVSLLIMGKAPPVAWVTWIPGGDGSVRPATGRRTPAGARWPRRRR